MRLQLMKSSIEELAQQAHCQLDKVGYGEGNLEDFAVVIIKQCMSLVNDDGKNAIKQYFKEQQL